MSTSLFQLLADYRGEIPPGGLLYEEKQDGYRAGYFTGADGTRRLWTRSGLPIEGTGHILSRLQAMERAAGERMFFDAEFQVGGTLAATKAWCERGHKQGGHAGHLYLFDAMPLAEWRTGGSDTPLVQRKARLAELVKATEPDPDAWEWPEGSKGKIEPAPLSVLPDGWVFDHADAVDAVRRVWAAGGEGCVFKDAESPYRRNRNGHWLKAKGDNQHKWLRRAA